MGLLYSRSESIARAVADDLSAASGDWAYSLICKFNPLPAIQLKDIPKNGVLVNVRDLSQRSLGLSTREDTQHEYDIEVVGRVGLSGDDSQTLSRLKLLCEQLIDWFWLDNARPTNCEETLERIESISIAEDQDLEQQRIGKVSMTLVFNGYRERP